VQQQTTWNEIPEKTNSSSSLTKNTLCSFLKFLRAPNPKPGVHWSLNNQVGTYIEACMMQQCSSVFHILPNEVKKKKKLHELRFGKILFKTNSAKINSCSSDSSVLLDWLTCKIVEACTLCHTNIQKLLVNFHNCRETLERTGTCEIPFRAAGATRACCSWQ
jgi:hypothetical protein